MSTTRVARDSVFQIVWRHLIGANLQRRSLIDAEVDERYWTKVATPGQLAVVTKVGYSFSLWVTLQFRR